MRLPTPSSSVGPAVVAQTCHTAPATPEYTVEQATVAGHCAGGPTTAAPMVCEIAVVWPAQAMPGTCAKAILRSCTLSLYVDRPHGTSQAECTAELATCRLARSGFTVEVLAQRDRRPVGELRIDGGGAPATASVVRTSRYTGVRAVYSICRRIGCDYTENEPGPAPAAQRRLRRWCERWRWSGRLKPCLIRAPRPSCAAALFPLAYTGHTAPATTKAIAEQATVAGPSAGGTAKAATGQRGPAALP